MNLGGDGQSILSLLIGAIVVDVVFLGLNFGDVMFRSRELTKWYTTFGVSAVGMDVLVITLVTLAGVVASKKLFEKPNLLETAIVVVLFQVAHDFLFYKVFSSIPRGTSFVMDVFKDYGEEVGVWAVLSDSLMVVSTLLIAEGITRIGKEGKAILLMLSLYVGLYALHSKKGT